MEDRIRELRKYLKLTQSEFGKQIGVSIDAIKNIEYKRVVPSELIKKMIVAQFNVSMEWLETGEGEMFGDTTKDAELAAWIGRVLKESDESIKKRWLNALKELDEEQWAMLDEFVCKLAGIERNGREEE